MDIIAKNLVKTYKNKNASEYTVIKDISLEINHGEFVSIMGPSGSGKSTLLYLLSGMEKLTSGKVELFHRDITLLNQKEIAMLRRSTIGFVFQFYNLIMEMNVFDNIILPNLIGKQKINMDRFSEVLEYCGLKDFEKKYPYQLSGGEQQRVAVARVLYMHPKIIFADEPTGNLDSENGIKIMELFKKINKENDVTIILVTHNNDHASYANNIITIKDGKIINSNREGNRYAFL